MNGSTSVTLSRSAGNCQLARLAVFPLLTVLALGGPHAGAEPTIDAGLTWLRGQQNQQGSWAGEPRLAVRGTGPFVVDRHQAEADRDTWLAIGSFTGAQGAGT